jgi:hypothetical protein
MLSVVRIVNRTKGWYERAGTLPCTTQPQTGPQLEAHERGRA